MNAAELDAVTLDAHGTLVTLADPVPALTKVLSARGIERTHKAVLAGFQAEAAHYAPKAGEGHDEESLARLQQECAGVFLEAISADLDPKEFAPAYVGALRFEVIPGVFDSLERLRALGLELAVVANWDVSLRRLRRPDRCRHHRCAGRVPARPVVRRVHGGGPRAPVCARRARRR